MVESKNDQEALLQKPPKEEQLVGPLKKAPYVILNHAQLIVLLLIGLLGPLVTRLVEEEANKEPVKLHSPRDLEERNAHKLKKSKPVTMPHAQLTVLWTYGVIGLLVIRPVDQE